LGLKISGQGLEWHNIAGGWAGEQGRAGMGARVGGGLN